MWFLIYMLISNLLLPLLMIIFGRIMWKHCPKDINGIYGYRTRRSRKNQDTWKFAHEYCGKLWWRLGFVMLILTVLVHIPLINCSTNTIGKVGIIPSIVQCGVMLISILFTESALKRNFTEDGIRK